MKISTFIKNTLNKACVYFSLITAVYALLVMITHVDDDLVLLDAGRVLLFFVASILFAFGNAILTLPRLNGILKVIAHYIVFLFTFWVCFMLPISPEPSGMIIGIALFTLIYAVSFAIVYVIKSRYKTRAEKQQDYRPQFKK